MTARRWTSRSTSSVAQVRRPSWTVIFRTPAFAQRPSQEWLKFRSSIGVPPGCEYELVSLPSHAGRRAGDLFLLLSGAECGHADTHQRQHCGRSLGLGMQDGTVTDEEFVDCIRESLPYA